jgi:hypothetical protein
MEALHERQAGINHHCELACKHNQVLRNDLRLQKGKDVFEVLGFFFDTDRQDALSAQLRHHAIFVRRLNNTLFIGTLSCST